MDKVNVQSWMSRDQRDQLARLAAEADRSLSAEVRRALTRHLETRSDEKPLRQREATPR